MLLFKNGGTEGIKNDTKEFTVYFTIELNYLNILSKCA